MLALPVATACGSPATPGAGPAQPFPTRAGTTTAVVQDSSQLIPAGYGTLRQDEIAIRFIVRDAIQVRLIPLDENVTRLLAPDSWRAMRDLRDSRAGEITAVARRFTVRDPVLFYVSFFGVQPEATFNPTDLVIATGGREFRPLDLVPLTTGFREQRIRQREIQSAIYIFEEGLDVRQPFTVSLEGITNASWAGTLRTLERERALVRSRATQGRP